MKCLVVSRMEKYVRINILKILEKKNEKEKINFNIKMKRILIDSITRSVF